MKKRFAGKLAALAVCGALVCGLALAGCSGNDSSTTTTDDSTQTTTDTTSTEATSTDTKTDDSATTTEDWEFPNGAGVVSQTDDEITIVDFAGREVTFAANAQRLYTIGNVGEMWLWALCPDRILGVSSEINEVNVQYVPEGIADLPVVGGWFGQKEGNVEAILATDPQVIIMPYMYDLTDADNRADAIQTAQEYIDRLGVPVVVLSGQMLDSPKNMAFLGQILGLEERGEYLAEYIQSKFDMVAACVAKVPESEIPTYYYAEQQDGLSTELTATASAIHLGVENFLKLKVAHDLDGTMEATEMGMVTVSMEQVLQWDPDIIIVFNPNAYTTITTDPTWSDLQAVQNGKVYWCPNHPQNWFDRSPNPFRVLGCMYAAAMIYPDYVDYDLDEQLAEFFKVMFDLDLTEAQVKALYTL